MWLKAGDLFAVNVQSKTVRVEEIEPTGEMDVLERFLAGTGGLVVDIGQRNRQRMGALLADRLLWGQTGLQKSVSGHDSTCYTKTRAIDKGSYRVLMQT